MLRGRSMNWSASEAGSVESRHEEEWRGLGCYRGLRPFKLITDDQGGYDVIDIAARDRLGKVVSGTTRRTGQSGKFQTTAFLIDLESATAPAAKVIKWNEETLTDARYTTAMEAADALWSFALPWKSRSWRAMRRLVLGYDWALRFVEVFARLVLIGVVLVFAASLAWFLWEVREVVHDIILQWLEAVRDRGPGSPVENGGALDVIPNFETPVLEDEAEI